LRRHGSPGVARAIFRELSAPSRSELRNTMANLFQFIQDVRTETEKVTWPTRRETLITSGIVIVLVIFISLFFLVVDEALRLIVSFILSFGH
jgi:preprotein translocase subunit SecE